jgi:hypothetical protein
MKTYAFRLSDVLKSEDCYNEVWNYRYIRYILKCNATVDVPYGCNCKPILREFDYEGSLIGFDDLSMLTIIAA